MKISNVLLVLMLSAIAITVNVRYNQLIEEEKRYVSQLSDLYIERFQKVLNESLYTADFLKATVVGHEGEPPLELITTIYEHVYNADIHHTISYLPDGVLTYSYPVEQHAEFIGKNLFDNAELQKNANEFIANGNFSFAKPYIEIEDMQNIAIHTPVFIEKNNTTEFWGFVSLAMEHPFEVLRDSGAWNLESMNCEYNLQTSYDNTLAHNYTSANFEENEFNANSSFSIENAKWTLDLYRANAIHDIRVYTILIFLAYTCVAILLYFVFRKLEHKIHLTHKASLVDPLTKLGNKKGLAQYEEENLRNKDIEYTIFYLDLNLFKPVNDNYGHSVGDALLAAFASRLRNQFKKGTYIARQGGDEFTVIVARPLSERGCEKITKRLAELASNAFVIEEYTLYISSSIGHASYPKDGKTFEQVMAKADERMLEYKETNKQER